MTLTTPQQADAELRVVTHDLYRDIHKGIRAELFAATQLAGSVDPSESSDRTELARHVRSIADLLASHAQHEDGHIQPAVETHLPLLAAQIAADHERLDSRMARLVDRADAAVDASSGRVRADVHRVYVELASFTSAYLAHQDVEERVVMPALEDAIGVDAVVAIHGSIIASIPPDQMAATLAVMLPAMNVDDRTELLGGMQAEAPAEAFQAVWRLAGSVLCASDHAALGARLGLS